MKKLSDERTYLSAWGAVIVLSTVLLVSSVPKVFAQQTAFEKTSRDGDILFSYQWNLPNGKLTQLSFSVNQREFLKPFATFRSYDRKRALRELNYQVNQYIQRQRWYGVEATLSPRQEKLTLSIRKARTEPLQQRYQQQLRKVQQFFNQQWQDYLSANYYRKLSLPLGETGIVPDAVTIAEKTQSLLRTLVVAIGNELKDNSRRSYTNYVGHFVQSIPYDSLSSKLSSRGDGFTPPNYLLLNNRGDCDSKVSLTLALLKEIIPEARMIIVYFPKHAIFGIQMAKQANDITLMHNGTEFVLMDVAGPAVLPAGQLSSDVQFLVNTGQYTVIKGN